MSLLAQFLFLLLPFLVAAEDKTLPVRELVHRLIPSHADQIGLFLDLKTPNGTVAKVCVTSSIDKYGIEIHGSDVNTLATGVLFYLNSVNASVSWEATGGDNLEAALPPVGVPLPQIEGEICRETTFAHRYYFNVCTYGYSTAFWSWERWEKELDWMALHGINLPLAGLGAEFVWSEVFENDFGIPREDLSDFFPGPAYLPWHWMGNLDKWKGPLSMTWMERSRQLQHKFVLRARSLGMRPVLPAFAGFVPNALKAKFPSAKIHDASGWNNFSPTHYLDPTDPLFSEIGSAFVKRLCEEYGCDDEQWFSADPYNELTPPSTDPRYIKSASSSIYNAMAAGIEPGNKAVWLAQAWMWESRPKIWGDVQIEAFLNGPPLGNLVMLDLYAEVRPIYSRTKGFFSHPWLFSTIFNFGGRSGLYGRLGNPNNQAVSDAVEIAIVANRTLGSSPGLVGLGAAPEAIETDPIMYDILFESAWVTVTDKDAWVEQWATRRYASFHVPVPSSAVEAWGLLKSGPYSCLTDQQGPSGSLIAARPDVNIPRVSCCAPTSMYYNSSILVHAWRKLLLAGRDSSELRTKSTYAHDVADVGVQVLSNLAVAVHGVVNEAIQNGNRTGQFSVASHRFLGIINDTEALAATQRDRLLGKWIQSAKACAGNEDKKDALLYELNARTLVTLWGDKDSHLHEYSYRLWGGLVSSFYYPRWKRWFDGVGQSLDHGQAFNQTKFVEEIEIFEEEWTQSTDPFPIKPSSTDPYEIAIKVYKKYFGEL